MKLTRLSPLFFVAATCVACTSFSLDLNQETDERWQSVEGDEAEYIASFEEPEPAEPPRQKAGDASASAPTRGGPAEFEGEVSDEDLDNFADAVAALEAVNHKEAERRMEEADSPEEQMQILQDLKDEAEAALDGTGMDLRAVETITRRIPNDDALQQRVDEHDDLDLYEFIGHPQPPPRDEPQPSQDLELITGAPQPHAHAFIIGIDNYRSVTPTPGARRDAEQFAELLETTMGVPDQNIHLLLDEDATRTDIVATLSMLQDEVDSDGRIYFFFSGHGTPEVQSGESYLLPYEGRPETIEHSGVALDDVLEGLEETPAREILAFVDACFSGSGDRSTLPEGTRPLVPVQETEPGDDTRVAVIASSSAQEISGTTADGDQGLFTHHLIRAIGKGRADIDGDGQISLSELHDFVAPRVARDARDLDRDQNPTLTVSDELGDPEAVMLLWGLPRN